MLLSVVRKQILEIKENTKRQRWNVCLPLFTLKKEWTRSRALSHLGENKGNFNNWHIVTCAIREERAEPLRRGVEKKARSENDETIKSVDKEDVTIFFVPNWNECKITFVSFAFCVI